MSCWKRIVVALPAFDTAGGCVAVRVQVEPSPTAPPPRALLHMRLAHTRSRPRGNRAPPPTATPPGVRPERRLHKTFHRFHGQSCARAHCNTSRYPPAAAAVHVTWSHSQPCSRAHRNTSRCPSAVALCRRLSVPFATVRPRPLQKLQVSAPSGSRARQIVPLDTDLPCPPHHVQVSARSGICTRPPHTAALLPQPPQHRQVPVPCGSFRYEEPLPRTAVRPHPLQYFQVPAPGGE